MALAHAMVLLSQRPPGKPGTAVLLKDGIIQATRTVSLLYERGVVRCAGTCIEPSCRNIQLLFGLEDNS